MELTVGDVTVRLAPAPVAVRPAPEGDGGPRSYVERALARGKGG